MDEYISHVGYSNPEPKQCVKYFIMHRENRNGEKKRSEGDTNRKLITRLPRLLVMFASSSTTVIDQN